MKRFLLVALLAFSLAIQASAQSASEISAARALAQQYGYSETEINAILENGNRDKGVTAPEKAMPLETEVIRVEPAVPVDPEREPSPIYGHDFFLSEGMGVIPLYNAPAPESYILGPGDEITIDMWGSSTQSVSSVIAKDGSVNVPGYGPVYLGGMTVSSAEKALKSRLSKVYGGLASGTTSLKLSLGRIKGVSVNVLGEVNVPGVYNLPSLSSVVSAIYIAGGITDNGSVRNISLYRGGKLVGNFDLYAFIFDGKYDSALRLQENDVISVASCRNIVDMKGYVVREMQYEMLEGESLEQAVKYAGGYKPLAFGNSLHVDRRTSSVSLAYDIDPEDASGFVLEAGDEVYVPGTRVRYENRLAVAGAVRHGGVYALSDKIRSVKDLIEAAGGVTKDFYSDRAFIVRVDDGDKPYMVGFDLGKVLSGEQDVMLQSNDSLRVFAKSDLRPSTTVEIRGEVNSPGIFDFGEGMTVGDIILMAGGLTEGAAKESIEVASIGKDVAGSVTNINLADNPDLIEYELKPFDMVFVRRYSYFKSQQTIQVEGEVSYPGTYVIEKSTVRLSDVVSRAGGITDDAYVNGARLTRMLTDDEYERITMAIDMASRQANLDSLQLDSLSVGDRYTVAINLKEALAEPGSYNDLTLRSGDILEVPQFDNTVKISGAVLYPNTVTFNEKYGWKDYVSLAGGFVSGAARRQTYAIYMNGMAATRGTSHFRMEPGMEIIVPRKEVGERRPISMAEVAALASSSSSMAYMIAALVNMLKKP